MPLSTRVSSARHSSGKQWIWTHKTAITLQPGWGKKAQKTHMHIFHLCTARIHHTPLIKTLFHFSRCRPLFFFFFTVWSKCLISKGLNMTVTDFSNNARFASFIHQSVSSLMLWESLFHWNGYSTLQIQSSLCEQWSCALCHGQQNPNSINNKPFWLLFIKNHKAKFWEVAWWLLCELVRWQPERFISQFPYQHALSPNWVQADERMMKMEKKKERGKERRPYCSIEISV